MNLNKQKFNYKTQIVGYDYKSIISNKITMNLVYSFILLVVIVCVGTYPYSILMWLVFPVTQILMSLNEYRFFISEMVIEDEFVKMFFFDKGVNVIIEGPLSEFKFKKRFAISRTREPYLAVYFKNIKVVEQFLDATKIDWIEEYFNILVELTKESR